MKQIGTAYLNGKPVKMAHVCKHGFTTYLLNNPPSVVVTYRYLRENIMEKYAIAHSKFHENAFWTK
jgi:hypothetical protein